MKRLLTGLAAVLIAAPLMVSAQTSPADKAARDTKAPAWKNDAGLHETKDIIGTRIKNLEGKDIGEIDQLLIDRNGKVSHAVIGLGGFAGVGEKKVVVPWSELKFAPVAAGKKNSIVIDEAKLVRAPYYERTAVAPSASPSTRPTTQDTDGDGKSDRTDKAPLDPSRK